MAKNRTESKSGKTSGINSAFSNFTDKVMEMFNEAQQIDRVDKTLEITAKQKGIPATTEALKKLNKEISSIKKNLKDDDITADMYSNSTKLNESVKSNIKTLEELQKKAKIKNSEGKDFGIGDTKNFYETYYVVEEQLAKMGKEMPDKFKKAFNDIQKMSSAVFKGSTQQIDDFYDISLSEIKDKAIKRANRGMTDVVSEIKARYKTNAEARLAELTERKEKLNSGSRSSSAIDNLKQLNQLGFTDDGEIDRSRIIFKNYEQCEKVISNIKDNLSYVSNEDSEKNLNTIQTANQLLEELESRLIIIGENKSFDKLIQNTKNSINEAWNVGDINDDDLNKATSELESLRNSVDSGELSAKDAANMYEAYSDSLIQVGKTANETAKNIRIINGLINRGIDSNGNFKTYKDMFQQGDTNDSSITRLDKAISFLNEHTDLLDWDQLEQLGKAQSLLNELQEVQRGYRNYSAEREAWLQKQNSYDEIDIHTGEDDSSLAGQEEAETFDKIEDSAEDAAEAKRKFVEANKEVFDSIVNTLKWLGDEDEGFRKLADNLGIALSQFGDFSSSSNFSNFIEALDKIIEKIEEVATKTGKIGLNLNYQEDNSMEAKQAEKATDAYYATILSRMRNKAKKIQSSGIDVAALLFDNPRVSDLSKRYNDTLSEAQEALALGNIDKVGRSNEENVKAYLQYFETLRTARDNVKTLLSEYQNMIKTGLDSKGRELSDSDKANIKQLIAEYKADWAFLLSPAALPSYTITQVSQEVNKINGVTSMGKQSAADKKKKAGSKFAEMLGIEQQDTEGINTALQQLIATLDEIKGILLSISQKDVLGELLDDKSGKLEIISQKIADIIQKVKELNQVAGNNLNNKNNLSLDSTTSNKTPDLSEEGKKSVESYAEGVKEGESAVKGSVTSVMEASEEAGMEALDEHSPSVVYRIMGQNSMEGYILGVKDKQFELIDAVGNVLKSGFLNNGKDVKWLDDFWKDLVSKDTFSIEQLDLLPDNQDYYKTAFSADIKGNIIQENNLTDALKSTALAVRDVAKANEERIRTEKELSTEVEKIYEGEYIEEGQRSSRNMKRTKVADGLYEYEEEISPGRRRRYQERFNDRTQEWEVDEIISTDYDKLVSEAVDATVKLTKAQHNLDIEQRKQRPNINLIMEYNAQIREAQELLDRATLSAHDFAYETVHAVNDPGYDTKYVMGMFNDAVNEQSFFKLSNENIRFYSKLRSENESTQKSIDATTRALAGFESQVRATEYSYDQNLSPGLTKPVTRQSDLDELRTRRDEILGRINSLRGTAATVDDITELRKLISEYQLLAKAKRDANNVVDKNLGGDTLEVKVSKQIAQIDKLISKSEQYGDETQDITDKLKEQKKALEDTVSVNPTDGKMATSIEAKDFYEVQSNVKILGSQLDSNIVKIKEQKKLINKYLKAYADQQKSFYEIELLKEKGESENKNAIVAETKKMEKAAKALEEAKKSLQSQGFDFSSIQNDKDSIDAEKGNVVGKYYDQVNVQTNKRLNTDLNSLNKISQDSTKYIDSFRAKIKALEDELKSFMNQGLDFNDEDAKKQLEEIKAKVTEIKTEAKSDDVQLATENTIEKTKYKIAKFIQENSAMTDEYRSKLRNLEVRLEGTDLTKAEVNDIVNSFIKLETEITKAGQTGKSFFATIKDRLTGLNAQLIAQYLSFQDIIRYARQAATNVIQLNDAFVELSKVSNTSLETLESDFQSYADIAHDIGGTISDTINATADWARMGMINAPLYGNI